MKWVDLIIAILSGLAAAIPLVLALVKWVKTAIQEKNWIKVLEKVVDLMETAETKFEEGAERKEWVIAMLKACADDLNYEIDYNAIAEMIDRLCAMSKVVNADGNPTMNADE